MRAKIEVCMTEVGVDALLPFGLMSLPSNIFNFSRTFLPRRSVEQTET